MTTDDDVMPDSIGSNGCLSMFDDLQYDVQDQLMLDLLRNFAIGCYIVDDVMVYLIGAWKTYVRESLWECMLVRNARN